MSKRNDLDSVDRKIINILMKDANTSYVDIAKHIHVSPGTVHVRMKRLQKIGIIEKAFLNVNYPQLGYDICAFLGIYLEKGSFYHEVINDLKKIPEITNAYYTTGEYSIFAKVICRDTEHLRDVLHKNIQRVDGIQRTETIISLEESIFRPISILEPEDLD